MGGWDLAAMALGWFFTFSGVALGGYLVFKTKYVEEGLFGQRKAAQGGAFIADEIIPGDNMDKRVVEGIDAARETLEKQTGRFMSQFLAGQRGMTHHLDETTVVAHPEQVTAMAEAQVAEAPDPSFSRPAERKSDARGDAFNLDEEK